MDAKISRKTTKAPTRATTKAGRRNGPGGLNEGADVAGGPRQVIMRFRLSEGEYNLVQEAVASDAAAIRKELEKRGLIQDFTLTTSEWARMVVLRAAVNRIQADA